MSTTVSILDANSAVQSMTVNANAAGVKTSAYSLDGSLATYRASANFTPAATAALTVAALRGSASKVIHVTRVCVGGVSTALSSSVFRLIRVSALGAGGTVVTPIVAKLDTAVAAATAVAEVYTSTAKVADTTAEGPLTHAQVFTSTVTTPTVAYVEQGVLFPERASAGFGGQSIILRGVSEILAISNVTPANLGAGTVLSCTIEWWEE